MCCFMFKSCEKGPASALHLDLDQMVQDVLSPAFLWGIGQVASTQRSEPACGSGPSQKMHSAASSRLEVEVVFSSLSVLVRDHSCVT